MKTVRFRQRLDASLELVLLHEQEELTLPVYWFLVPVILQPAESAECRSRPTAEERKRQDLSQLSVDASTFAELRHTSRLTKRQ